MNLPTIKPRWARGDIGREIGSWILAEIREHLLLAGIDGRRINAGNLVGIVPTLAAKIAIFVNMVYKGTWSVLNLSSNFTAAANTDPYFTADPYLSEDWNQALDIDLSDTGVTPGTYGDASYYPTITVDAKGRVTAAGEIAVPGAGNEYIYVSFPLTGGGSAISTGVKEPKAVGVPNSQLVEARLVTSGASGNLTVDIKRATYADFPTFTSIVGAATKPNIANAAVSQKYSDTSFTSWTATTFAEGDMLQVEVTAVSTLVEAMLVLKLLRVVA